MPSAPNRTAPAKILIVDDNALGQIARKGVLTELGHVILTSSSPHEALEMCLNQHFDVIVTDYKMPLMNGVEFIRELRARGAFVPIILLSGFTDALGLSEANTGADAVIQKSANEVAHLTRAVNRLLKKPVKKPAGSQASLQKRKDTTKGS